MQVFGTMRKIGVVTILGANGMMGTNISAIFAAFGCAKVYMVCRTLESATSAIERAVLSVRADSIRSRLVPADYSMLETCILESDLVFETVREDYQTKQEIFKSISGYLKPDTLVASGTSGLSINGLAKFLPEANRKLFVGMHFFNPPYQLVLCELIPSQETDPAILDWLNSYLSGTLLRSVADVTDSPAFLGNRIGFFFLNEALLCAERFRNSGGIDYIDAILGSFTGRGMAPIDTIDFVGLDVHKAIIDNIRENVKEVMSTSFHLPEFASDLIGHGLLGRKTRGGLYQSKMLTDGQRTKMVYDLNEKEFRACRHYVFDFAEHMKYHIRQGNYKEAIRELIKNDSLEAKLCLEFLLRYISYALYAANQVSGTLHTADVVMAEGFNWCPPLAMVSLLSRAVSVKELIIERLDPEFIHATDILHLLDLAPNSNYDYRRYFRSAN